MDVDAWNSVLLVRMMDELWLGPVDELIGWMRGRDENVFCSGCCCHDGMGWECWWSSGLLGHVAAMARFIDEMVETGDGMKTDFQAEDLSGIFLAEPIGYEFLKAFRIGLRDYDGSSWDIGFDEFIIASVHPDMLAHFVQCRTRFWVHMQHSADQVDNFYIAC